MLYKTLIFLCISFLFISCKTYTYGYLTDRQYRNEYGHIERYGNSEEAHNNKSLDNNYFNVNLESRKIYQPKRKEQFHIKFYFYSFNINKIYFNKVIIIKNNDRVDVTDRLVLEEAWHHTFIKNIENRIVDVEHNDGDFHSEFPIVIYESTINRNIKEFYVEYDFDVEFINGERQNFNKTVKLIIAKREPDLSFGDLLTIYLIFSFLSLFGR